MKNFRISFAVFLALAVAYFGESSTLQAQQPKIRKPSMDDTIKANMYADNWFVLYIHGELVAVDSIKFIPHNVISVDILPTYPMTIAVMAKDNSDPKTGMEYADIDLDNTVLFRHVVKSPPDGKPRADFSKLNDMVPDQPPRKR